MVPGMREKLAKKIKEKRSTYKQTNAHSHFISCFWLFQRKDTSPHVADALQRQETDKEL